MSTMVARMVGAARFDTKTFEEVEADSRTLGQAMAVVVISSVAAGVGSLHVMGLGGILLGTLVALAGWYVWAYITYMLGTKILPEPQTRADHGQLLRTIGFSSSPGIIRAAGIVPGLTGIVFTVAAVWMLIAMIVAVRQALDYRSTWRAVGVCVIGWAIQAAVVALVYLLFRMPSQVS